MVKIVLLAMAKANSKGSWQAERTGAASTRSPVGSAVAHAVTTVTIASPVEATASWTLGMTIRSIGEALGCDDLASRFALVEFARVDESLLYLSAPRTVP